ncbi:hypothetical protein [Pyxidicoccus caerfyrddinensis]|uniref:hypothetical protein n=1 Tax=Pyxidicoccus caerfyrddinensis TaxID=2709663 RepID=UPI0013DB0C10|nr:hypothetical protein [Pyxidicoccus caerfyrddinensis]
MTLEREANSALAEHRWSRFRQGLKRLERKYARRIPTVPLRRALAEDAFHCATHSQQSPRVVRAALRELLTHPLGVERYGFAAAEYWKWAARVSPSDLPTAEHMVEQARHAMTSLDPLARENLERMLRACEDEVREALTLKAGAAPEPPSRSRKERQR